ncbi:MAG: Hpt domain-containing protein, partial [Sulfuricaulis sp.]|nr:Hpt domain-containing protein [Sulfuricaulis sp.]
MSTHSKVDLSTLGWVKTEIDETLKQARLALETFAENPSDKTRLRFCVTHLHQVVGTLLMVELDGAAMLAKETEALAEDVINDKVTPDSRALDALTRGILTLPDYLARLQAGQADVPLKHIGLMNEMRAVRKTTPISELELFSPDLSVRPAPSETPVDKLAEDEYRELAKQLRGGFQSALLDWLRDVTNKASLKKIAEVFEQLQAKAGPAVLEQLFWVTGGFLAAIEDDGLDITAERKKLFARLDQHLKKIIDGADKSTLRTSSELLIRALLWEIAQAKSRAPRVTRLKRAFDLEFLLFGDTADAAATTDDLPTPEALASVSTALGKEIEAAQDLMSTYFDPESHGTASLAPLLESFHKMSGTLDMLNVPLLKSLVDELSLTCRAVIDNKVMNPERISMPMAEALLMVESSTRDISRSPTEWKNQIEESIRHLHSLHSPEDAETMPASDGLEVSDAELTESDYKQLLSVVASEVGINLGRIEEALESFASDTTRLESLDEVPQLLSQILGAMQILGQTRAADLVEVTKGHVDNICRGLLVADSAIMDGLAVSVGTIGAYNEGLRAERQNLDVLIDSAFEELETALASGHGRQRDPALLIDGIRLSLESWLDDCENEAARETLTHQLEELIRLAEDQGQDKIARISTEMNHLLTLVAEDPSQLSEEIIETLKHSFTAMSALAGRRMTLRTTPAMLPETHAEPGPKTVPASPIKSREIKKATTPKPATPSSLPTRPAADAEFDAEIMEIFVEDARDVLKNIRNNLIVWRDDTENQNALTELRRGYHTLKGSGRMVGASEVAELSWDVENVLNRIREGKIVPTTAIIDLMQQTQDALPHLIDVLAGGPAHGIDVDGLREIARALANPGGAPAATPRTRAVPTPEPVSRDEPGDLPKLDRALLDIFTTEAFGNLDNIRQQIAHCRETGSACFVTEPFFRSVHTLQGNARSLGLHVMSQACAEIEKLLHALKSEDLPLNETYLGLVSRFESAVTRLVELMNSSATSSGTLRQVFTDLARELRAECQHVTKSDHEHYDALVVPAAPEREIEADVAPEPELDETPAALSTTSSRPKAPKTPPSITAEPSEPEQLDPELLEIFQEEATDILTAIEETLTRWQSRPEDRGHVAELKRSLHTLKGGARMAGAMAIGSLSHNTETLLKNIEDSMVLADNDVFDLLHEAHDMLVVMLDSAREGRPVPPTSLLNAKLVELFVGEDLPYDEFVSENAPELPTSESAEEPSAEPALEPEAVTQETEAVSHARPLAAGEVIEERHDLPDIVEKTLPDKMERRGQIRVNTSLLNDLVNYAGEVSISRSRMEQQIFSFRDNLGELSRNIVRFREQIRELEIQSESQIVYRMEQEAGIEGRASDFDPLEFDRFSRLQQLSRSLAESLHDLGTIQNNLGTFVGEAETVLQQQARINTELQEGLMRTRMVSFSTQAARLRHIVRQTSRELGKRVELNLENAEVELDRNVLERMIGPFEHMIRNSIDHGIESESERRRKGKPALGRINIVSSQEGAEVIIRFSDDGAGLNIAGIR